MLKREFRINTIDNFRGLSICYMIFGHTIIFWLRQEDQWLRLVIFLSCEVIGANLFILLAGMSLVFAYHSYQKKISSNQGYTPLHAKIDFGIRTLWIVFLAFLMNIIGSSTLEQLTIWIWNVLLTIAIARFACYPFLHFSPWYRVSIGTFFFILADPMRTILYSMGISSLFYLSFDVVIQCTPFPFFGFLFIGSALGDWLKDWRSQQSALENGPNKIFPRNLSIVGLILIGFGVLGGSQISTSGIAFNFFTNPNIYINLLLQGLPIFLIRGSGAWSFYCLGFELLIFAGFLRLDIYRISRQISRQILFSSNGGTKKVYENSTKGLILFGQYSLTVYVTHYLIYFIFPNILSVPIYFIAFAFVFLVIYCGMWLWANQGKGYGTIEWTIQYSIQVVFNKMALKLTKKRAGII